MDENVTIRPVFHPVGTHLIVDIYPRAKPIIHNEQVKVIQYSPQRNRVYLETKKPLYGFASGNDRYWFDCEMVIVKAFVHPENTPILPFTPESYPVGSRLELYLSSINGKPIQTDSIWIDIGEILEWYRNTTDDDYIVKMSYQDEGVNSTSTINVKNLTITKVLYIPPAKAPTEPEDTTPPQTPDPQRLTPIDHPAGTVVHVRICAGFDDKFTYEDEVEIINWLGESGVTLLSQKRENPRREIFDIHNIDVLQIISFPKIPIMEPKEKIIDKGIPLNPKDHPVGTIVQLKFPTTLAGSENGIIFQWYGSKVSFDLYDKHDTRYHLNFLSADQYQAVSIISTPPREKTLEELDSFSRNQTVRSGAIPGNTLVSITLNDRKVYIPAKDLQPDDKPGYISLLYKYIEKGDDNKIRQFYSHLGEMFTSNNAAQEISPNNNEATLPLTPNNYPEGTRITFQCYDRSDVHKGVIRDWRKIDGHDVIDIIIDGSAVNGPNTSYYARDVTILDYKLPQQKDPSPSPFDGIPKQPVNPNEEYRYEREEVFSKDSFVSDEKDPKYVGNHLIASTTSKGEKVYIRVKDLLFNENKVETFKMFGKPHPSEEENHPEKDDIAYHTQELKRIARQEGLQAEVTLF